MKCEERFFWQTIILCRDELGLTLHDQQHYASPFYETVSCGAEKTFGKSAAKTRISTYFVMLKDDVQHCCTENSCAKTSIHSLANNDSEPSLSIGLLSICKSGSLNVGINI